MHKVLVFWFRIEKILCAKMFPVFFDIANVMGILQISYLISQGEASEEDKFWYNESEKGLEFSNSNFWNGIFEEDEIER